MRCKQSLLVQVGSGDSALRGHAALRARQNAADRARIENVHSGYVHQALGSHRGERMFQAERPDWRTNYELRRTPVEKISVVAGSEKTRSSSSAGHLDRR